MTIDHSYNIIDSLDIIERIEELEQDINDSRHESTDEEKAEYKALKALAEECERYSSDWTHGETLISRIYWVEYVQDMLADCGTIPKDIPWFVEIDWEATARNVESDYSSVYFDGEEYLIRSC